MSTRWHESWRAGRIGFHSSEVHQDLIAYESRFLSGGPHRVFVPLCGKSVDMAWLAERGHQVVGVELVPQAVEDFFKEHDLQPTVVEHPSHSVYSAGSISIFCADIFALQREDLGEIDRIWDRAALVALPSELRVQYTAHLRKLVADGAILLQNVFEFDQSKISAPPFSISDEEVRKHFDGCTIELLNEQDALDKFPRFQELGNEYWTVRCYQIDL
jgi:thiopurine S-methyltransferase